MPTFSAVHAGWERPPAPGFSPKPSTVKKYQMLEKHVTSVSRACRLMRTAHTVFMNLMLHPTTRLMISERLQSR